MNRRGEEVRGEGRDDEGRAGGDPLVTSDMQILEGGIKGIGSCACRSRAGGWTIISARPPFRDHLPPTLSVLPLAHAVALRFLYAPKALKGRFILSILLAP